MKRRRSRSVRRPALEAAEVVAVEGRGLDSVETHGVSLACNQFGTLCARYGQRFGCAP